MASPHVGQTKTSPRRSKRQDLNWSVISLSVFHLITDTDDQFLFPSGNRVSLRFSTLERFIFLLYFPSLFLDTTNHTDTWPTVVSHDIGTSRRNGCKLRKSCTDVSMESAFTVQLILQHVQVHGSATGKSCGRLPKYLGFFELPRPIPHLPEGTKEIVSIFDKRNAVLIPSPPGY